MLNQIQKATPPKDGWKTPGWGGKGDERGCVHWRSFTKKTKVNRAHDTFDDMPHDAFSRY